MGIRRWIADKIATTAHRNPEPPPGPDAQAAPGGRAAGTGTAIAVSRDAAQRGDAGREAWFQYLDGQEPANEAEARWFETFREGDRRAQARYSEERQAWQRYAQGKAPAHDAEARWSRRSAKPTARPKTGTGKSTGHSSGTRKVRHQKMTPTGSDSPGSSRN